MIKLCQIVIIISYEKPQQFLKKFFFQKQVKVKFINNQSLLLILRKQNYQIMLLKHFFNDTLKFHKRFIEVIFKLENFGDDSVC